MQGVVFLGERKLEVREFPDPTPGQGEVVVQMKASGMCGSDLKFYRAKGGPASLGLGGDGGPVIAGHEPCGVVAEVGPGVPPEQARVGQRVMVHHYKGCGHCKHCQMGWAQMCPNGFTVYGVTGNGGHAPYIKVPASTLVELPDELSFETGAAVSCGTGTAWGALRRVSLTGPDVIAIFGQGPVGLSATQLAVHMGARVIALDVNAERRAMAERMGADKVIDPKAEDVVQALHELTHGEGVDVALDASSSPEARLQAVQATKRWGRVCYVGEGDTVTLDVSRDLLRRQITLYGSWTFSNLGQAECARYIADRRIAVDDLFTERFTDLSQAEDAYKLFDTQTTGKGVFTL